MPPIWVNEDDQPAQPRPCPRPGCGREVPIRRYRYETLRQIGRPLFRVARYVEWCGHGQELVAVPDDCWVGAARAGDWYGKVAPSGPTEYPLDKPSGLTASSALPVLN